MLNDMIEDLGQCPLRPPEESQDFVRIDMKMGQLDGRWRKYKWKQEGSQEMRPVCMGKSANLIQVRHKECASYFGQVRMTQIRWTKWWQGKPGENQGG
jgi:hypothetical protein